MTFDDDATGDVDLGLYFADGDQVMTVPIPGSHEAFSSIDGNRVALLSNAAGNYDVWLYEFLVEPFATIEPTAVDFGAVTVGGSSQQAVTIAHPQNTSVAVEGVTVTGSAPGDFVIGMPLPIAIGVGGSLDLPIVLRSPPARSAGRVRGTC